MEWIIDNEEELGKVAGDIVKRLSKTPIVLLHGELGAGKTRLVKFIVQYLESKDDVSSPTFSLINEYRYPGGSIYHMDMYRIRSEEEALQIGVLEYLDSGEICLIEWPEIIQGLIIDDFLTVEIEVLSPNSRKVIV